MDAVEEGWDPTLHFILKCNNWCHKQCSGLRNLQGVQNFVCRSCAREGDGGDDDGDDEAPGLVVNRGMLEEVEQFCYLGDVLDCEAGVERAVQVRVTAAWRRW